MGEISNGCNSKMKLYVRGKKNQTLKKGRKRDKGERFEIPSWLLNKINQHFEYLQCVLGLQK